MLARRGRRPTIVGLVGRGPGRHARYPDDVPGPTITDPARAGSVAGHRRGTVAVWVARLAWVAVAVLGGGCFGEALADRSRGVQVVATAALWVGWGAVALALAVPSTVGLTVARTGAPIGVVAALVAATTAQAPASGAFAVGTAAIATAAIGSGELGQVFAQGSAYGHELRFVLRPPAWTVLPLVVSWAVLCALVILAPLTWGAQAWIPALLVTGGATVLGWVLLRRFHRLARRWLVLVPAGLVIHDHLVLGETVMLRTASLSELGLALDGTDAADLTGPAGGHAVEVVLRDHETIVFAPTRATPNGSAIHARAVLVAPTRPGRFLAAAGARGLPVR